MAALPAVASGPSGPRWPDLDRGPTTRQAHPLYVVQPGDTLWRIAREHLAGHPSGADVARAWPRWYRDNRNAIGPDADLIHPGQRLRPPSWVHR
jgi:nucleoid-associated protein YgaU